MLNACFRAEMVKLRKSWPMLAAILAPICLVGFLGVIFWYSDEVVVRFHPGSRFLLDLNVAGWNLFVLPAVAAMMAELSWAQDRDASVWRHLLCQPRPRVAQYLAKLANLWALVAFSQILLFALVPPVRLILLKDRNPWIVWMMGQTDMALFWEFACFSLVASIPVVAFHTWFSFRLPGAGPALGVALVGTWASTKLVALTYLMPLLPWGLSGHAATIFDRYKKVPWEYFPWKYCYGALSLSLALAMLGALDFKKHAFTKSLERE